MYKAIDVANWLIRKSSGEGRQITNLKLQKLLYYSQGFCLVFTGEPLFEEIIEKWSHGPVVPDMYHRFKRYGSNTIPDNAIFEDTQEIDEETSEMLDDVFDVYGKHSAWSLRNLTHEEKPWISAIDCGEITHDSMREFFVTLVS